MPELIREIVEADLPRVKELLVLAKRKGDYSSIERLGGMTNRSYKVTLKDGETLLVRIPGEGTEEMINRLDERKSTQLACDLHIDSELMYFGDDGTKVMAFIHDPQEMNEEVMKRSDIIQQAAEIFHRLHFSGVDTGVRFEVFEMADLYEKIIRDAAVPFYDDYLDVKQAVMEIKAAVDSTGMAPRVPCHNDSLIGNWVLDGDGKLFLVDWEYSGMNEAMWDLSCLSIEADYSPKEDNALLKAYYGFERREAGIQEMRRFIAAKLYVDYLWTLWGLTRVPYDGAFMQDYADSRYKRLKKNIDAYQKLA